MHTNTPPNSTFDGPITNLLSRWCILTGIYLRTHAKGQKSLNDSRFGILWRGKNSSEGLIFLHCSVSDFFGTGEFFSCRGCNCVICTYTALNGRLLDSFLFLLFVIVRSSYTMVLGGHFLHCPCGRKFSVTVWTSLRSVKDIFRLFL